MGTQYTAKAKIEWFKVRFELARKNEISLSEKKLIAQFVIEFGSTERKAKEIIKTFETAELIKRIGGEIAHKSLIKQEMGISSENQLKITREAQNA